jgi:molybdate transport system ATP-binding protein
VRDNLVYGTRRAPRGPHAIALDATVDLLGIGALLERRPMRLSGGEKQRVAIGRALLAQPRVLLMDEPLASLDAARRQEILPYIERLRDELRILIVYVSHSMQEVVRLANTIVVIDSGGALAQGTPAELSRRPEVRRLFGHFDAGAVLDGRVDGHDDGRALTRIALGRATLVLPRIDYAAGASVRLRIRARDVMLATSPPANLSVQNVLAGRVTDIVAGDDPHAEVQVQVGDIVLFARVTRDSIRRLGLAVGSPVYALLKSVAVDGDAVNHAPIDVD